MNTKIIYFCTLLLTGMNLLKAEEKIVIEPLGFDHIFMIKVSGVQESNPKPPAPVINGETVKMEHKLVSYKVIKVLKGSFQVSQQKDEHVSLNYEDLRGKPIWDKPQSLWSDGGSGGIEKGESYIVYSAKPNLEEAVQNPDRLECYNEKKYPDSKSQLRDMEYIFSALSKPIDEQARLVRTYAAQDASNTMGSYMGEYLGELIGKSSSTESHELFKFIVENKARLNKDGFYYLIHRLVDFWHDEQRHAIVSEPFAVLAVIGLAGDKKPITRADLAESTNNIVQNQPAKLLKYKNLKTILQNDLPKEELARIIDNLAAISKIFAASDDGANDKIYAGQIDGIVKMLR